jgi:hypothetical protein
MKLKIILGILAALVVLLVVAVLVVGTHLGQIAKAGIELAGPKVTQTTLTVDAVDVSLFGGSAGIKNLVLGNPDGYQAPHSISVSNAAVTLVPSSVLSSKIVIRSVVVTAPEITFEGNPLGANNLSKIMNNVDAMAAPADRAATNAAPAPANSAAPAGEKKPAKKLEVDDFLITGAKVQAHLTGLVNQDLTIPLPDIHLSDLGTGPDGITAADLTKKILNEVTTDVIKALASSVTNLGKDVVNGARNAAAGAANGVLQNVGVSTTNVTGGLKKGLDSLFGK